jgi:hypothetical protein
MEKSFGIYIYEKAHPQIKAKAEQLLEEIPGSFIDLVPNFPVGKLPKKAAALGGEFVYGRTVGHLLGHEIPLQLYNLGTNSVLWHELSSLGYFKTTEEFLDLGSNQFSNHPRFHPGKYGKVTFINQFGRGSYEVAVGNASENTRWLHRVPNIRTLIQGAYGFAESSVDWYGDELDVFSVVSRIGKVEAFPNQDLFGKEIKRARVAGFNHFTRMSNLKKTLVCWKNSKQPSSSVLNIESESVFNVYQNPLYIWVDGDTVGNPNWGEPVVRVIRDPRGINVYAG